MNLQKIRIVNYRSLGDFTFEINNLNDGSAAFGLIGVNEAGKSSILTAIALKDGLQNAEGERLPLAKDFSDKNFSIIIDYYYSLTNEEIEEIKNQLNESSSENEPIEVDFQHLIFRTYFNIDAPSTAIFKLKIPECKNKNIRESIEKKLLEHIKSKIQKTVFWTAEKRYLISAPISLSDFASNPEIVSIPLKNSFLLAGISDIPAAINKLTGDSTEVEYLEEILGEAVTKHISNRWPGHPIKITFSIVDGKINFHVRDTKVKVKSKAKTADQRSDGFRQFISFLLTVSAENINKELSDTILLLDEPETHLHPKAQENLLDELIKIASLESRNIVLFATHSIFMIDKSNLSRNFKISKENALSGRTQFNEKGTTYSGVTYEVFGIASSDYHNELYSQLHARYQDADTTDTEREKIKNFDDNYFSVEKQLKKDRPWKGNPNSCTLPTYIRNCIHHSDNGDKFTLAELEESIEVMLKCI